MPNISDHSITDPVSLDVTRLNCLLYADDIILLSESEKGLQSCLDNLNSYCHKWKLKINISKTKGIVFSKGKRKTDNLKFYIENKKLEVHVVGKYKYLGVSVSYNGNLKFTAEQLCNKSLKAVFSLKSKIFYFDFSDMKLKLKLRDSLIRPIISYASEIWISDITQKELKSENLPFEKIHNRFCKYLLGVHKKSSNFASRCELCRLPILRFIRDRPFNLKGGGGGGGVMVFCLVQNFFFGQHKS